MAKTLEAGAALCRGKYRIGKVLGQGSFGITYLASARFEAQGNLGRMNVEAQVAVKEFFMSEVNGRKADGSSVDGSSGSVFANYRKKFRREAENLARLDHPDIVKVLDIFDENNTTYYVMEFIEGQNLDDYIRRRGGVPEAEALALVGQAGVALSYMHSRQMLHLDIKPKNIMRRTDGTVCLIDFGLSKQFTAGGEPESSTTIGLGTPGYAPIEQARYRQDGTFPATLDVYALGATLFKLLTGQRPPDATDIFNEGFPEKELSARRVSPDTLRVLRKAMAPARRDRYQSVSSFMNDLKDEGTVVDSEPQVKPQSSASCINGHEYVDLGLPSGVKWATCNVGASSPSDYGDYFAWGETSTKSKYTKENSKTYEKSMDDIAGNSSYDSARANWGGSWRLPTQVELKELEDKCTWTWTTANGHKGYRVQGPNGNSIFLPAAGWGGNKGDGSREDGYYWSATPHGSIFYAYGLNFGSDYRYVDWYGREDGYSVRPVSGNCLTVSMTKTKKLPQTHSKSAPAPQPSKSVSSPKSVHVSKPQSPASCISGHEYVDLGLPSGVKWATCNVGASSPSDYGDYFAWGETSTKSEYTMKNSKTCRKTMGDIAGNPAYDAARANWGGSWRLPTQAELKELQYKCTWTWTTENGHKGCRVKGPNGNSIFLPAAGLQNSMTLARAGEYGKYWSSTQQDIDAYSLDFNSGKCSVPISFGLCGCSVRPVSGKCLTTSTTKTLPHTHLEPAPAPRPSKPVSSSKPANVSKPQSTGIQLVGILLALIVLLFVIAGVFRGCGNTSSGGFNDTSVFADTVEYVEGGDTVEVDYNGHDYVDLGLSVKWATCNVGASSPSDYGEYFAWGETSAKLKYTKENSKTYGKTMGDIAGSSSYDAARANWGGSWRLPTKAECEELQNRCTWTWGRQNGHNGYRVKGPNGKSIFLPAADFRRFEKALRSVEETSGSYWSSTPDGGFSCSYVLSFGSNNRYVGWCDRYFGHSVRPVSE